LIQFGHVQIGTITEVLVVMIKFLSVLILISLSNSPVIAASFEVAGLTTLTYKTPVITPQKVPDAKCFYKSKTLELPGSRFQISQFEVWTIRSGNKEREPSITGYLKLLDKVTLKNTESIMIPMTNLTSGFITDRLGNPKSVTDTVIRRNVDIGGAEFHLVFKRTVNDVDSLEEPTVQAEMLLYKASDKSLALQASCTYQKPAKK
jgi:hypothetical protein